MNVSKYTSPVKNAVDLRLRRIADVLLLNASFTDNPGLLNGKMGIAIFLYHYAQQTGIEIYETYAGELIDEIYEMISTQTSVNFADGLTGIGWGIEYLVRSGFIETDTDEALAEIDKAVYKSNLDRSDGSTNSSLIVNTLSGNAATVELYLSGGGGPNNKWHYISTPVSTLAVSTFTGVTDDIAQFVESRPEFDMMEGWVAYDGYAYSTGSNIGPTFSTLNPGKGYNYYDAANQMFTFSGSRSTVTVGYSASYKFY